MHVWLITAFEPIPSDRVRPMRYMGLADQLIARGYRVTVVTTTFFHHTKAHRFKKDTTYEVVPGYKVVALRSWGYRKNVSVQRFLAHWHLAQRLRQYLPSLPEPDVIMIALPPLSIASTVLEYGAGCHVPVIVDVIDPWPDIFISLAPSVVRPMARVFLWPLYRQARNIMQKASALSAISNTYLQWGAKLANSSNQPKRVFYPAVDISSFDALTSQVKLKHASNKSDKIRFVYAGALSRAYDVETIIACARILAAEGFNRAEFLIAGSGPKSQSLHQMAVGLPSVKLLGWLGAEDLARLFAECHVGIACYSRYATQSVTYKLFDYLAAGLPILSSLPGEMSGLIVSEHVGRIYPAENPSALTKIIKELANQPIVISEMSRRARSFAKSAGDSKKVYGQMVEFLSEVVAHHPTNGSVRWKTGHA